MGDSREEISREFLPQERMMVKVDSTSNVDRLHLPLESVALVEDPCTTTKSFNEQHNLHPFSGRASLPIKNFNEP